MRRWMRSAATMALVALNLSVAAAWGEVRLPAVISSHMVLQRDTAAPIWGWADAGEVVRVKVDDQEVATARADADGRWRVALPARPAGGPVRLVVSGTNTIELDDVLFGEVWLCSGQSNMQWTVKQSAQADEEVAQANWPAIRVFTVKQAVAGQPQEDCVGQWVVCSPETVGAFSAVGYYFGRMLHQELAVPVGLVHSSWGGTRAEAWTSRPTLESHEALRPIVAASDAYPTRYVDLQARYEKDLQAWEQAQFEARQQAQSQPQVETVPPQPPRKPRAPIPPERYQHGAAALYNAMICPLAPYAIKGAIWYQGESNVVRAQQYRTLLPAMIDDWRQLWGQGDFPFGIVQLANYHAVDARPVDSDWAELRDAQAFTAAHVANCGMAVIIDIGTANDIHPRNKQDVGRRLGLWAMARTYGREIVHTGPVFAGMQVEGDTIRVKFGHGGAGLVAREMATPEARPNTQVHGFAIAGEDRRFVWAQARIDASSVVVSSPDVPRPVAVRYAWSNNPQCNLFNQEGLPAGPFRSDNWPAKTDGKYEPQ